MIGPRLGDGERAICGQCAARQPRDWRAGDLCGACGGTVRRELRCPWCARLTPAARFCRGCGSETVDDLRYGAARMLKAGGVDRFALGARLAALDDDLIAHLTDLYAQQRAVVARRVDEVALCERALVLGGHAARLEDVLIAQLPLDEPALAALAGGPQGPFDDAARLPEIAATSPLPATRALAALAQVRTGPITAAALTAARAALDEPALAGEAALALAHWRTRAAPWWECLPTSRIAVAAELVLAGSPPPVVQTWAAVAIARHGPLAARTAELGRAGLDHADRDLRLACALALADAARLTTFAADRDPAVRAAALPVLARHAPAAVGPWLTDGDDDERAAILAALPRACPPALGPGLVAAIERGDARVRKLAASRLGATLTAPLTARALAAVLAHGDADAAAGLLRARPLPDADAVITALAISPLPLARLADALAGLAEARLLTPARAIALLDAPADEPRRRDLLRLAERVLGADPDPALARAITRIALGPHPAATRAAAIWALRRTVRSHPDVDAFALTPASIAAHFADPIGFAAAFTAVLTDDATLREVGVFEWLTDRLRDIDPALGAVLARDPPGHAALLDALIAVAAADHWLYLRTAAAIAVGALAAGTPERARMAAALDRIDATDPIYDLRYHLQRSAAELR